jgi:hypothetical protein
MCEVIAQIKYIKRGTKGGVFKKSGALCIFLWNSSMAVCLICNEPVAVMKSMTSKDIMILKLHVHEASRETSQVGRLPAPSYLPLANVYLPEIRSKSGWKQVVRQVGEQVR